MKFSSAASSLLLAFALTTPWQPADAAPRKARVGAVSVPAGMDGRWRTALGKTLERELDAAQLAASLDDYVLAPSLVQLRRYVKDAGHEPEWVCVVDLALLDANNALIASVRGNAATARGAAVDTLEAATHAAVARLPETLQALGAAGKKPERVAGR